MRVASPGSTSRTTSPPRPPSPPSGPPRGTYFSRRKLLAPLPPSPALTKIFTWSRNTDGIPAFQRKKPCTPARGTGLVPDGRPPAFPALGAAAAVRLSAARPTGTSGLGRDGLLLHLDDADPLALLAVGLKDDHAAHAGVQGVVPAAAHVAPGHEAGTPLTHQNAAGGHPLAAETLHAQPLGGAVPPVAGAAP